MGKGINSNDLAFEALFNNATIGIMTVDKSGTIVLANPYSLVQFGYEPNELNGKKIEVLIPDRFAKSHVKTRENYTVAPVSRPMGLGFDLYGRKKDGSEFPVEISLSHYNGYMIAFIIDITTRKENEQKLYEQQIEKEKIAGQLKVLNEELEQKVEDRTIMLKETLQQLEKSKTELTEALEKERELNDLKSRFVSMASHEFRTPLSTILSSVSLIEKYRLSEEQEKRDKHIQRIKSQVKNMANILEEFLSLGKLEESRVYEKREHFNICDLIDELVSELYTLAKMGQTIKLNCEIKSKVFLDPKLLRNILVNLITNALKYSPENSEVTIHVYTSDQHHLYLSIKDKGIGISDEDQKHLMDRFFRGTNAINIQGTGLGLHIVKKYLELMNGDITIKSKLNQGTEVTLAFNQ